MSYLTTFTSPRIKSTLLMYGGGTNKFVITPANPAADRILNIIDTGATDDFIFKLAAQTLSNKTLGTALAAGGFKITGLADPTSAQDAATKAYVDTGALGLDIHTAAHLATAAALPTNTYSGGGKTLTATGNAALTVDGVAVTNGDRILVKNEVTAKNNGIYVVTQAGSGGTPYILTRAADFDSTSEVDKLTFVFVEAGTANGATGWTSPFSTTVVLDTDAINWTQFNGSGGSYTAGSGITLSGGAFSIDTSVTVSLTGTQTLTNKTLTTPKINYAVRAVDLSAGGSDTTTTADCYVDVTTGTTANASVVLPAPSGNSGLVIEITKVDSGTGNILVSAASGSVLGVTNIDNINDAITYRCTGTLWRSN